MGVEIALTYLYNIFNNTTFFGSEYVIQVMFILITMAIITRHVDDWKVLAFPVCYGWMTIGIHMNYSLFILTLFLFVVSSLSIKNFQDAITGIGTTLAKADRIGATVFKRLPDKYSHIWGGRSRIDNLILEKKALSRARDDLKERSRIGMTLREAIAGYGKEKGLSNQGLFKKSKIDIRRDAYETERKRIKLKHSGSRLKKLADIEQGITDKYNITKHLNKEENPLHAIGLTDRRIRFNTGAFKKAKNYENKTILYNPFPKEDKRIGSFRWKRLGHKKKEEEG